jgi:hypothetical protein
MRSVWCAVLSCSNINYSSFVWYISGLYHTLSRNCTEKCSTRLYYSNFCSHCMLKIWPSNLPMMVYNYLCHCKMTTPSQRCLHAYTHMCTCMCACIRLPVHVSVHAHIMWVLVLACMHEIFVGKIWRKRPLTKYINKYKDNTEWGRIH